MGTSRCPVFPAPSRFQRVLLWQSSVAIGAARVPGVGCLTVGCLTLETTGMPFPPEQPLRHAPKGQVYGRALFRGIERRKGLGFLEHLAVVVVDPEIVRVLRHH